ncbi:hypothetical protein DPMN_012020 [Dreissena polymorpha]|uniref:Uncharacterized protein n=1 Tax=Dreissena polymorpha TaxID=45954 RepID=A0A9D4S0K1_DREPO|nr:hypothetical protein DPMN_012020 [Dreissena polymorpha]
MWSMWLLYTGGCCSQTNILTKFHEDWMKTVTSIVYTSDLKNILTKFHKDWMKTVTSTVYTNKLLTINILTKFHKDWMKTVTSTVYTSEEECIGVLSSDNHLVDGQTDRLTDRPT